MLSCSALDFDRPRPLSSSPESAPAGEEHFSTGESRWRLPVVGRGGERHGEGREARNTMPTDSMDGLDCQGERSRVGRERYGKQKNGGERGAGNADVKGLSRRTPLRPFVVHLDEEVQRTTALASGCSESWFVQLGPGYA